MLFLRHLRFLVKATETLINSQPTLSELQNQATVSTTVVRALQTQVASNTRQLQGDHASSAEEKDGRLNEKCVGILFI
jgi:hypothetical protein